MIKPARLRKGDTVAIVSLSAGTLGEPWAIHVNFGHAEPIGIIPYGIKCRLDAGKKTLTLLEPATGE